jgi:hypothetical protein
MPTADQLVARIAERQHSVFTFDQALSCGLTPDMARSRVRSGRWVRVHRAVYAIAGVRLTFEGRVLAALLAAGIDAVASDATAGRIWKIEGISTDDVHLSTTTRRRVRLPGVFVHQRRDLRRIDTTKAAGVPITTPGRTLMDLASSLDEAGLEDALDDVLRRKLIGAKAFLVRVQNQKRRGRSGLSLLEHLVSERVDGRPSGSGKENLVRRFFKVAGLPPAVRQYEIRTPRDEFVAFVDFAYPDAKLAVEFDGYETHSSRKRWEADLVRQNRMVALGWYPVRVTDRQLKTIPKDVIDTIWSRLAGARAAE